MSNGEEHLLQYSWCFYQTGSAQSKQSTQFGAAVFPKYRDNFQSQKAGLQHRAYKGHFLCSLNHQTYRTYYIMISKTCVNI